MYVYTAVVLMIAEGCYYVSGGVFEFMIQISFLILKIKVVCPFFFSSFFYFSLLTIFFWGGGFAHIDSAVTIAFSHVH